MSYAITYRMRELDYLAIITIPLGILCWLLFFAPFSVYRDEFQIFFLLFGSGCVATAAYALFLNHREEIAIVVWGLAILPFLLMLAFGIPLMFIAALLAL